MMDADLSHDPKYLPEMLRLAGNFDPVRDRARASAPEGPMGRAVSNGVDLVVGCRYMAGGGVTKKWDRNNSGGIGNALENFIKRIFPPPLLIQRQ